MRYLITGGCGFLGSNIASQVLKQGGDLLIYDNLSRLGGEDNLKWLKTLGKFEFIQDNVNNYKKISSVIKHNKPDIVYHLAGQVAMTTSLSNPRLDFETNVLGSFNILESVRLYSTDTIIVYSSTNKVYGDFEYLDYEETPTRYICKQYPNGFDENVNLDFHSPYGCSKGSADQYMLDYARMFGLKTVVFRHSSMYGARQFGTFDQGWISWFVQKAIETIKDKNTNFTISGNGKQVRDVLHAEDMINLYLSVSAHIKKAKGQVFNIGGGMQNSLSLLELFDFLNKELGISMNYTNLPPRESDQKVFVADIQKASKIFEWTPKISKEEGIRKMIEWVKAL
ncbi:MAG: GDP-mannose 4,6-dehydratase [Helicobacteraceae bacterium]|nr:GDP-mannose 4,6-dehydratase [Helicobacteraceae bacterium]